MPYQPVQCPNCGTLNLPELHQCTQCNGILKYKTSQISPKTIITLLIAAGIPLACCGLCQMGKTDNQRPSTTASSYSSYASPSPIATPSLLATANSSPKVQLKSAPVKVKTDKTGVVISENANLRKTPENEGEILAELPENTDLQIVKQKGAWFLVSANGQTGWLHGNTIRLNSSSPTLSETPTPEPSTTYSSGSSSGYYTGPRGGCYTYTSSGRKRYVDHSYCR